MYRNLRKRQGLLVVGCPDCPGWYGVLGFLFALTVLLLAACNPNGAGNAAAPPPPASPVPPVPPTSEQPVTQTVSISPTVTLSPTTSMPVVGVDEMQEEAIRTRARQALADQLGVVSSTLTVSDTTALTWPDSAVGCPDPDQVYMQVLTPGYLLTFRDSQGQVYEVHTTLSGNPLILCQEGRPVLLSRQ